MEKNENISDFFTENKIEPFSLIHDILVNWWVILLGALAAAMLTYSAVHMLYEPQYTTSTTLAAMSKGNTSSYSSLGSANTMADTFSKIIKSSSMQKILKKELKKDDIDAEISTSLVGETNLLELRVSASSPKEAYDVIKVILNHYSDISYYSLGGAILEPLQEPEIPLSPSNALNAFSMAKKAFLAMAALLVCLFGVLSCLRDTIKRAEEVESKLDARSLGNIPYEYKYKTLSDLIHRKKEGMLITNPLSGFSFVESYRKLASQVEYKMEQRDSKVLVVTSISENEGKSTVAVNLAISLAERSGKVLLIDGDLRRPSQFLLLGMGTRLKEENEFGEFLKDNTELRDVFLETKITNLYYIGGKNCYSTSTEMLQNLKTKQMLEYLKNKVDYIIIDSPPAGIIGDAEIYAQYADEVLLVTRQNFVLAEDINDTLDRFREQDVHILGVVLNGVRSIQSFASTSIGRYGKYGYGKYRNYAQNHRNGE